MNWTVDLKKTFYTLILILAFAAMTPGVSLAAGSWSQGFPKVADQNVMLQWAPVKGATDYVIYRSVEKGKGYKKLSSAKATHYIDSKPASGKTYYYKVAAVVGGKETEAAPESSVSLQVKAAEKAMTTPNIAGAHIKEAPDGTVSVGLRYEGGYGKGFVGFNIYRSESKGAGYAMVGSTSGDTYEDKDVVRGKTYFYYVTAVDDKFNETKPSAAYQVDVPAPSAAPVVKPGEQPKVVSPPPTPMRKTKHLFTIDKYRDETGKEVPLETTIDVVVDEAVGHIYVVSGVYGGVLVYDMEGRFQFGIKKDGAGGSTRYTAARGLALGPAGLIYVCAPDDSVVGVYEIDGRLKKMINVDISDVEGHQNDKARLVDIAVDNDGNIYVADMVSSSIIVLDPNGKAIDRFGYKGETKAKVNGPSWCAIDKDGNFLVVDTNSSVVKAYNAKGKYLRTISRKGDLAGELDMPAGLAVTGKDEVFVASGVTPNIQAFNIKTGAFLYAICNEKCDGPPSYSIIRGIYVDSKDRLYVTESILNRVDVYQLGEQSFAVPPEKK